MPFVPDILSALNAIRGIPGQMGLRPTTVTVRVRTSSGDNLGEAGVTSDVDTVLLVGNGQNPKVRSLTSRETFAAGGKYQEGDIRVGPMTPDFVGGGVTFDAMVPPVQQSTEVYYRLDGPGSPTDGQWCVCIGSEVDSALHRYLILRPTGTTL